MFFRSPALNPVDPYQGIDDFSTADASPALITPATDNACLPCKPLTCHPSTATITFYFPFHRFTPHDLYPEFLKVCTHTLSKGSAVHPQKIKWKFIFKFNALRRDKTECRNTACSIIPQFGEKIDLWGGMLECL